MFTPKNENNLNKAAYLVENRTIWNIYKDKCYNYLENETFAETIYKIFLIIWSIIITLILTYPEIWVEYFKKLFMFENMIIPKWFVIFYIMLHIEEIKNRINSIKKIKIKNTKIQNTNNKIDTDNENQIFWIPILEIIKHLFEEKHFKRTDIESKFLLPRNQYTKLAKKLEEIWILKRWENNSRILNEDYTEKQIAKAFVYCNWNINDLKIQHEEITPNHFTTLPLNA